MPAKSKAQQRFFAIAEHEPSKLRGKMPDMTQEEMHKFAATKVANKPEHVKRKKPDGDQLGSGSHGFRRHKK